uniref:Uncharacterized protein n=1 Tax=Rhizophora mucronata TaxID=61149 RepID=A0A2P2PZD6_RHIMU
MIRNSSNFSLLHQLYFSH